MEKFVYYNELYLIYKDLLNTKNSEIFDLYYGDNLSMQEISEIKSISKSRVGIIIKSVESKLDSYEKALHIHKEKKVLNDLLEENDISELKNKLRKILKGE